MRSRLVLTAVAAATLGAFLAAPAHASNVAQPDVRVHPNAGSDNDDSIASWSVHCNFIADASATRS